MMAEVDLDDLKKDLTRSFDQTIKAELAGLELRLVDRLTKSLTDKADAAVVAEMDKRMMSLETAFASRANIPDEVLDLEKRMSALEKFRYAVPSVAFISMLLSMILVYYYTFHH